MLCANTGGTPRSDPLLAPRSHIQQRLVQDSDIVDLMLRVIQIPGPVVVDAVVVVVEAEAFVRRGVQRRAVLSLLRGDGSAFPGKERAADGLPVPVPVPGIGALIQKAAEPDDLAVDIPGEVAARAVVGDDRRKQEGQLRIERLAVFIPVLHDLLGTGLGDARQACQSTCEATSISKAMAEVASAR